MNDTAHSFAPGQSGGKRLGLKVAGWMLLALAIGFAVGFVPMWTQARTATRQLEEGLARATAYADSLEVARTYVLVSAALVEVERGDYESARSLMSRFYEAIDRHWQGVPADQVPAAVTTIRKTRDHTITLLSRGSPDAVHEVRSAHAIFLAVADPTAEAIGRALMPVPPVRDSAIARPSGASRDGEGSR